MQPIYTPALHAEAIQRAYTLGQASSSGMVLRQDGYIKDSWGVSQYVDDSLPKDANHASLYEDCKRWHHSQHPPR